MVKVILHVSLITEWGQKTPDTLEDALKRAFDKFSRYGFSVQQTEDGPTVYDYEVDESEPNERIP